MCEMRQPMTRRDMLSGCLCLFFTSLCPFRRADGKGWMDKTGKGIHVNLPGPIFDGTCSLEKTIKNRRTIRSFKEKSLSLDQLSQLLWAAQGITEEHGFKRSAPSAGALYPIDLYLVVGTDALREVEPGVYRYDPRNHTLFGVIRGDLRRDLARASLSQMWMAKAPVSFVITAEYARATRKYKRRGVRYTLIEAGHVGQNIFLQAEALSLGAGIIGAFDDKGIVRIMNISQKHEPLLIMPVGYKDYESPVS